VGTLIAEGRFGPGFLPGLAAVGIFAVIIGTLIRKGAKK
jgi:hypothetical protein